MRKDFSIQFKRRLKETRIYHVSPPSVIQHLQAYDCKYFCSATTSSDLNLLEAKYFTIQSIKRIK